MQSLALLEQPDTRFFIDSPERLDWLGRKLTAKRAELAALEANYQALKAALEQDLAAFEAHFMPQAEALVRAQLEGKKTRTLKTLGGSWSLRSVPGGLRKLSAERLLAWAKVQAPDLVETRTIIREDVPAEKLQAWFASTGEIPDGAEWVPARESFTHKGVPA